MIHPTAIISASAKLHKSVQVGPYCTIGEHVSIGEGTRLVGHVVITGHTSIGATNVIYPFASLGQPSPDRKYKGEEATLVIGDGNDIREYVTMHIGTAADRGQTVVGNNNLFMAGSHVAHDCIVGNRCIIANFTQLAGHVILEDDVVIGGLTGIAQHLRIGAHAVLGGHAAIGADVPPYGNVASEKSTLRGLNLVGLRRRGFDKSVIQAINEAYDFLFDPAEQSTPLHQRAAQLKQSSTLPEIQLLADFVLASQRGMATYDTDE